MAVSEAANARMTKPNTWPNRSSSSKEKNTKLQLDANRSNSRESKIISKCFWVRSMPRVPSTNRLRVNVKNRKVMKLFWLSGLSFLAQNKNVID